MATYAASFNERFFPGPYYLSFNPCPGPCYQQVGDACAPKPCSDADPLECGYVCCPSDSPTIYYTDTNDTVVGEMGGGVSSRCPPCGFPMPCEGTNIDQITTCDPRDVPDISPCASVGQLYAEFKGYKIFEGSEETLTKTINRDMVEAKRDAVTRLGTELLRSHVFAGLLAGFWTDYAEANIEIHDSMADFLTNLQPLEPLPPPPPTASSGSPPPPPLSVRTAVIPPAPYGGRLKNDGMEIGRIVRYESSPDFEKLQKSMGKGGDGRTR